MNFEVANYDLEAYSELQVDDEAVIQNGNPVDKIGRNAEID